MIEGFINNLKNGKEVRQTLSKIRQAIKDEGTFSDFYNMMWDETTLLIDFLSSDDAKTRKNAALLMGDLAMDDFLEPLFDAYEKEETLFVRSSYLTALKHFDYEELLPKLHAQSKKLAGTPLTEDNKKHITEELRLLNTLIVEEEGIPIHTFIGNHNPHNCVFLTNRDYTDVLAKQLTENKMQPVPFSSGIRLSTNRLDEVLPLRTYHELLFEIEGLKTCPMTVNALADMISHSKLQSVLRHDHKEGTPFYFRIELKSKKDLGFKSDFTKKLGAEIERLSNRYLINSPSNYEIELRLIENAEGNCHVMVKYATIPDDRFTYRTESIAASIKPVDAALLVALASPYMTPDAQVLDPFCGVGTMLIERQKIVKANTTYGIDLYNNAVAKAETNTKNADQIIHLVNKDFFEFTHEYLFDEIFTNMPFATGHTSDHDIQLLYRKFFKKAPEVLTPQGKIIMYSHNGAEAKKLASVNGFKLIAEFLIMKKLGTELLVFEHVIKDN